MKTSKLCILGNPVSKSLSPNIYNYLFDSLNINAFYSRLHIQDVKHLNKLFDLLHLSAVNVTMPHKQNVFGMADKFDEYSAKTESCNTLIIEKIKSAYNTDFYGFISAMNRKKINLFSKSVLLIGAGNTAGTVLRALENYNCRIDLINRSKSGADILKSFFPNLNICDNTSISQCYDIIINTAPDLTFFLEAAKKTDSETIVDFNYSQNSLIKLFPNNQYYVSGIDLLISQALIAYQIFTEHLQGITKYQDYDDMYDQLQMLLSNAVISKKNIALIGFSGAGKSTLGELLTSKLNMNLICIDSMIENKVGKPINKIFKEDGVDVFRTYEHEMLKSLENVENSVIICGGGTCESIDNVKILRKIAYNVLITTDLKTSWARIEKSQRPLLEGKDFSYYKDLFYKRLDNYFKCSDLIIYNNENIESVSIIIANEVRNVLC